MPRFDVGFSQTVAVKISSSFIWLTMSAKRDLRRIVVARYEHTPDEGQSWMRAYQQESGDALKKAIQLKQGMVMVNM